jgi:hypothetical protein
MREDRQLLMLTHLSQLLDLVSGIGGFVVPLILWILKKDEVLGMDFHGKAILNFRISMFLYVLICIPFILFLGLGVLGLIVLGSILLNFSCHQCCESKQWRND